MDFIRTDGRNKDFIENCRLLDIDLDRRVGKKIKRDKYKKYNQLDKISEAIVVYEDNKVVGGGAIRKYDDENIELKRVFVHTEYQGQGIGSKLDRYLRHIRKFQYDLERSKERLVEQEYRNYIKFLKYMAKGWMRPDLLPIKIEGIDLKNDWFNFFKMISYDKSEVGNYKVSGGVYKSYNYLEYYAINSLKEYLKILNVEKETGK